jgi:hypothetical protein
MPRIAQKWRIAACRFKTKARRVGATGSRGCASALSTAW